MLARSAARFSEFHPKMCTKIQLNASVMQRMHAKYTIMQANALSMHLVDDVVERLVLKLLVPDGLVRRKRFHRDALLAVLHHLQAENSVELRVILALSIADKHLTRTDVRAAVAYLRVENEIVVDRHSKHTGMDVIIFLED